MLSVYFFDPWCKIENLFFIRYICVAKVNKAKIGQLWLYMKVVNLKLFNKSVRTI